MSEERHDPDVPMIELHKVDAIIANTEKIVKDVKIIVAACMITILVLTLSVVYIFTSKYNERTSDWLKTYNLLRTGQTEVTDGQADEIQQLPFP